MTAAFNRRMRKTARTVVWEGVGAQSSAPHPIGFPQRIEGYLSGKEEAKAGAALTLCPRTP